jgi:hypothetical protein
MFLEFSRTIQIRSWAPQEHKYFVLEVLKNKKYIFSLTVEEHFHGSHVL